MPLTVLFSSVQMRTMTLVSLPHFGYLSNCDTELLPLHLDTQPKRDPFELLFSYINCVAELLVLPSLFRQRQKKRKMAFIHYTVFGYSF